MCNVHIHTFAFQVSNGVHESFQAMFFGTARSRLTLFAFDVVVGPLLSCGSRQSTRCHL